MQNIKIGIFLSDHVFARNLAESLARESRQLAFTILERLDYKNKCDIALTDSDLGLDNQVILVNSLNEEGFEKGQYRIFKYKAASEMVKAIAYVVYEITGDTLICRNDDCLGVISVFSLTGGSGVSEVSMGLCKVLYECFDKRCIYVNLSAHSNVDFSKNDDALFRKLIYYLKYKDSFPMEYFLKSKEEFEFISRGKIAIYQNEFTSEIFTKLLAELRKADKWKFAVIDCGNYLNHNMIEIIRKSDYVIMIADFRRDADANFDLLINELEIDEKRLIKVMNFAGITDEIPEQYIDLQQYDNIHGSTDFQYKMSLIGQVVGGELGD